MPGMALLIVGAMQQAPHPARQFSFSVMMVISMLGILGGLILIVMA
jgi:hypothetical protein